MSVEKYPVQRALDVVDGYLAARLGFVRMDKKTRSEIYFFERGGDCTRPIGLFDIESYKAAA